MKINAAGTCPHRIIVAIAAGVSARIKASSTIANAPVPTAVSAKNRLAHTSRFRTQMKPCTSASVKHAAATMDQMMVTQLK